MKRKRQKSSDLRKALRSLLSDIEDMYQGAEFPAERGHKEEFFGPFSVDKLEGMEIADVSISSPNLAISVENVKIALRKAQAEGA